MTKTVFIERNIILLGNYNFCDPLIYTMDHCFLNQTRRKNPLMHKGFSGSYVENCYCIVSHVFRCDMSFIELKSISVAFKKYLYTTIIVPCDE